MATLKPNSWLITRIVAWIETMTPSCRDITHLLSQSMDRQPSLYNQLVIWLHLTICDHCVRFAEHLAFIRKVNRPILKYAEKMSPAALSASAKERIRGHSPIRAIVYEQISGSSKRHSLKICSVYTWVKPAAKLYAACIFDFSEVLLGISARITNSQ